MLRHILLQEHAVARNASRGRPFSRGYVWSNVISIFRLPAPILNFTDLCRIFPKLPVNAVPNAFDSTRASPQSSDSPTETVLPAG